MTESIPGFNIPDLDNPPPLSKPAPVTKTNDAVVILRGVSVPLNSDVGCAFTADCARNRERIFSDAQLQEKYDIAPNDWDDIIKNKPLRLAISRECERRMLNGDGAREAAAKEFTAAPEVLGSILRDNKASPRHRIEASKELRATANVGAEKSRDDFDRVVVTITLGGDEKLVVDSGPLPPNRITRENLDAETEG